MNYSFQIQLHFLSYKPHGFVANVKIERLRYKCLEKHISKRY
jgi:hypothetical protein